MGKLFFAVALLVLSFAALAQEPVKWTYMATKVSDKNYEVHITATINQPWHIYSQDSPEGGALPTQISFNKNPLVSIEGKTKEVGKLEEQYEEVFDVNVKYYNNKVVFVQKVKMKAAVKTNLTGTLEYMACNNSQCLPPKEVKFSVAVQ